MLRWLNGVRRMCRIWPLANIVICMGGALGGVLSNHHPPPQTTTRLNSICRTKQSTRVPLAVPPFLPFTTYILHTLPPKYGFSLYLCLSLFFAFRLHLKWHVIIYSHFGNNLYTRPDMTRANDVMCSNTPPIGIAESCVGRLCCAFNDPVVVGGGWVVCGWRPID